MKRTFLALLAVLPFFSALAQDNPAIAPTERNKEKWWSDRHLEKLNPAQPNDINVVFLGDSITQGWEGGAAREIWTEKFAPLGAFNLGFSGDRTEHVLWRIDNGELDKVKPKVIVLLIGTNNIGHKKSTPAQTVEGTKAIIARIDQKLPAAKILLLGVFPRGGSPEDPMRVGAAEITKLYAGLADGTKVHFLDINGKLMQSDGTLSKDIMPDLLHLSKKGYEIWAEAILPKLQELLK